MLESSEQRDPLEKLAEEFAANCRAGRRPSVSDYVARYPRYAERIKELFPAVAMMEQYRTEEKTLRRAEARVGAGATVPERLGDFCIVREIGRGGMGVVYEAVQQSLARRVALKVLPNHALLLEKDRELFQREAQTAANLHHTHIVPIFGIGHDEGLHYYVMQLVRGVGLDEVIGRLRRSGSGGGLAAIVQSLVVDSESAAGKSEEQSPAKSHNEPPKLGSNHWRMVAEVGIQAARGLGYAHRQGTLHRDVKPGNLLVDEHGVVCVADFGLAQVIGPAGNDDENRNAVGTPRYAAPEQFQGKAEPRSDIYSLGLTLRELLTLCMTFDQSSKRDPTTPRDFETILSKCTSKKPEQRYGGAEELADDLQRLLDDRPIRARRVSLAERALRWCRRNPALAGVSALASLLLVAVAAALLLGHLQTRSAYQDATVALGRAEATSLVALDALDDIYMQLSPDRIWIQSGLDAQGEICVCLGLRSGGGAMQVHASEETAALLQGLLASYDRLAEQAGDDVRVGLQSAVACRRVGDIRQRLGQLDQARTAYDRAIEKLTKFEAAGEQTAEIPLALARTYNELGNVQSVQLDATAAYSSHRKALDVLRGLCPVADLSPEGQYETARTLYFLANKSALDLGDRRGDASTRERGTGGGLPYNSRECRQSAIRILDTLVAEPPGLPDYQFLLALCLRPPGGAIMSREEAAGRRRAIDILQQLATTHPEVLDYRYELAATYAWIYVGLFPWQRPVAEPDAEESLRKSLVEMRRLIEHNASIPHYACSEALVLAKLGELARRRGDASHAETLLREALESQESAVVRFPELPPRQQVLREFMRVKLAQVMREPTDSGSRNLLETALSHLETLSEQPALFTDRLLAATSALAREALAAADDGPDGKE